MPDPREGGRGAGAGGPARSPGPSADEEGGAGGQEPVGGGGNGDADGASGGDGRPRRWRRRRFLSAVGTSTAAATAGCSEITTYRFEADPVVLREDVRSAYGAVQERDRTLTEDAVRTVAGVKLRAVVTSHVAAYSLHADRGAVRFGDGQHGSRPSGESTFDDGYQSGTGSEGNVDDGRFDARTAVGTPLTVGAVATPAASVFGRELNPLADMDLKELVDDETGRRLLQEVGFDPSRFVRPFEAITPSDVAGAISPSDLAGAVTPSRIAGAVSPSDLAGAITPSDYRWFVGMVADGDGATSLVLANLVRASRGESADDVLLGASIQHREVPQGAADAVKTRPLFGEDGWVTPDGLAASAVQSAAFLPHLEVPAAGVRPFDLDVRGDQAIAPGEVVSDGEDGSPDLAVVLATPDAAIDDWVVYADETVADHNPNRDPAEPVVVVGYEHLLDAGWPEWKEAPADGLFDEAVERGVKFHAFPRSRLARHLMSLQE